MKLSKKAIHRQQGGTLVIVVVFLVALFGIAALALDMANVHCQRLGMQEAADAAAQAAMRSWIVKKTPPEVVQMGFDYGTGNHLVQSEIVTVETGSWNVRAKSFTPTTILPHTDLPAVRVIVRRPIGMNFAQVVGFRTMNPRVESIACAIRQRSGGQVVPWAVCDPDGSLSQGHCTMITLKYTPLSPGVNSCGSGAGGGNFGALALGGPGGSTYRNNIIDGYNGVLHVGDCVDSQPGNMVGPTGQGVQQRLANSTPYSCVPNPPSSPPTDARRVLVPRVDDLTVNGRGQVCITGFYVMALKNIDPATGNVDAQFLEVFNGDDVDPTLPALVGEWGKIVLVK